LKKTTPMSISSGSFWKCSLNHLLSASMDDLQIEW
jgi:hypothetical protein